MVLNYLNENMINMKALNIVLFLHNMDIYTLNVLVQLVEVPIVLF